MHIFIYVEECSYFNPKQFKRMLEEYFNLLSYFIPVKKKRIGCRAKIYKIAHFFMPPHKKNVIFTDTFYSTK